MAFSLTEFDEEITVSNEAIGFTEDTYNQVRSQGWILGGVTFTISDAAIRIRYTNDAGGNAPTATDGILYASGTTVTFDTPEEVSRVQMIRATSTDATVFAVYLKK
jgi:hypothetical protein